MMTDTYGAVDPTVRELPLAPGGELELRLGSNRLRVRTTDGDSVVIRGRTDHDLERDVEISSGEGWVRVTDGPAGSLRVGPLTVRSGGHTPDLDIEVPRNVRVSARTLSGDIAAFGIVAPSRWQSASGTVRLGLDGGPVLVETMSGDALLDASSPLAVTCRTVSGSVKVRAPRLTALDVATTSGDVTIAASLDAGAVHAITSVSGDLRLITGSEVSLELQSITGDIRASVPHRADGTRGRRTVVVGSGRVRVSVKTMSGDVRIKPGAPDALAAAGDAAATGAPPAASAQAPASPWVEFGRAWAESAKDWAAWGSSWAAGTAWGSPSAPPTPAPPAAPPQAPTPPSAAVPPEPAGSSEPLTGTEPPVAAGGDNPGTDGDAEPASEPVAPTAERPDDDTAPVPAPSRADIEAARMQILRSLERGELDVESAAERLAALEGVGQEEG